jgi:hypothetical protein
MLIKEIEMSSTGGIDLSKLSRENEKPFGFNNEIDNFSFYKNTQEDYQVYYLVDVDKIIAAMAGVIVTVNNKNYFQTKGVYVNNEYRRNDLALKMYHAIKHSENLSLMSDNQQTRSGIKLWSKLFKKYPTKVMDITTGKIVSDKIQDAYTNKNYVLVTETVKQAGIIIPPLLN